MDQRNSTTGVITLIDQNVSTHNQTASRRLQIGDAVRGKCLRLAPFVQSASGICGMACVSTSDQASFSDLRNKPFASMPVKMQAVVYLQELIPFQSVSSESSCAISDRVETWLKKLSFDTEPLPCLDDRGVKNSCFVTRNGPSTGWLPTYFGHTYFGHTDVGHTDFGHTYFGHTDFGHTDVGHTDFGHTAVVPVNSWSCPASDPWTPHLADGRAVHFSMGSGLNTNMALIPFLSERGGIHQEMETSAEWPDARFSPTSPTLKILIKDNNTGLHIASAQSECLEYFRPMPGRNESVCTSCSAVRIFMDNASGDGAAEE
jgi:hypothetical protein